MNLHGVPLLGLPPRQGLAMDRGVSRKRQDFRPLALTATSSRSYRGSRIETGTPLEVVPVLKRPEARFLRAVGRRRGYPLHSPIEAHGGNPYPSSYRRFSPCFASATQERSIPLAIEAGTAQVGEADRQGFRDGRSRSIFVQGWRSRPHKSIVENHQWLTRLDPNTSPRIAMLRYLLFLLVLFLSFSAQAATGHFSFGGHCYASDVDALAAFDASFPWQVPPRTITYLSSYLDPNAAGLIYYTVRSRDMAAGAPVSFNGSLQMAACSTPDPTFDYLVAGGLFAFFFSSIVGLWLVSKNAGLILEAVKRW